MPRLRKQEKKTDAGIWWDSLAESDRVKDLGLVEKNNIRMDLK